jgi:small subunit ribosomal protein S21
MFILEQRSNSHLYYAACGATSLICRKGLIFLAIKITVRKDEPIESCLKRFKRICDKEGIKKSLKQYSYYEKPSDRKRRKEKERIRNIRKQLKKLRRRR